MTPTARRLILPAILLGLFGTATTPVAAADDRGALRATAHPEASIVLARPVRWSEAMALRNDRHDNYLAAGTYRAVLDDAQGTFYTGPSPCLVTSIVTPEGTHFNGQDWLCGLYLPTTGAREPRVQSIYAGWWQQLAFLPDGAPDLGNIGVPLAGAPAAGTDPFLVIKGAPQAERAGAQERPLGSTAGAIPLAIFAAMDSARRGHFEDVKAQPAPGWFAMAGGAITRGPAGVRPDDAPVPAEGGASAIPATGRPPHARHLDATGLDGQVWTFPHPSHPDRFGTVRLAFAHGRVEASNSKGHAAGPFTVKDDLLCIAFDAASWGRTCYYVVDDPGSPASGPLVLATGTGRSAPLAIQATPRAAASVILATTAEPPGTGGSQDGTSGLADVEPAVAEALSTPLLHCPSAWLAQRLQRAPWRNAAAAELASQAVDACVLPSWAKAEDVRAVKQFRGILLSRLERRIASWRAGPWPVFPTGDGAAPPLAPVQTRTPACLHPAYPAQAQRMGDVGITKILVEVDERGVTSDLVPWQSAGPLPGQKLLDEAAMRTLATCRYPPAPGIPRRGGIIEIVWRLDNDPAGATAPASAASGAR